MKIYGKAIAGIFGIFALSTTNLVAAPVITSVEGNPAHNQLVTLSGSGFGTKPSAAPLKWDNFETGTAGNDLGNNWYIESSNGINPKYATDVLRTNSTKSVKQDFTTGSQYNCTVGLTGLRIANTYISFWRYITAAGGNSRNVKPLAIRHGSAGEWLLPNIRHDQYPSSSWGHTYANDCTGSSEIDSVSAGAYDWEKSLNGWHRVEYYVEYGTPGVSNGKYTYSFDGVLMNNHTNVQFRPAGCTDDLNNIYLNSYFATDTNGATAYMWVDDIYVDITQARVEVGDSATWANCTHREIQIPSVWADASITITMNQGTFTNGSTVYLYVVDANGNVNSNGYTVTIGGGNTSPFAPKNIRIIN